MEKELAFVKAVAEEVDKVGGKVYFVGGYVRDKFLNLKNKDIDVEVYGLSMVELEKLLSNFGEVNHVGASFGILMVKGYDIDFALPRTELKVGDNHTDFEVTVNSDLSLLEATKRRDFTMNAILQDVLTGKFIDLYGGIEDIKNSVIKFVNKDTYKEDELRAFRACQFSSRFNFIIDKEVIEESKNFSYKLSNERIFEEFNKALLKSEKPSIALNYMFEMGIIKKLFPELYALKGCSQSEINHPEGDVWNHTLLVLDEAARLKKQSKRPLALMYAALVHDMGKPQSQEISEDGKITFYDHENLGIPIAERFLKRLTNDKQVLKNALELTQYHMHAHKIQEFKESTLKKLIVKVDIEELLLMGEADEQGRGLKTADYSSIRNANIERIRSVSRGSFGHIEPYFKGSDLLDMGYKQGKEMGILLKEAYENQLNGQSKEHIHAYLLNRISPKKKPMQAPEVVDMLITDMLKNDKLAFENAVKRVEWFRQLKQETEYNYRETKNKIPYLEVISKNRDYKYVFTPLMVVQLTLNNSQNKVVFDTKNNTIQERKTILNKVLIDVHNKDMQIFDVFKTVFVRLSKK